MKIGTKTLADILGVVTAQGLNEHKTITMTPGPNAVTLTATNSNGSTRAKILAITPEDESIDACALPSATLQALAATSGAEIIEISKPKKGNTLAARAGAGATSLATSDPTDFMPLDPTNPPEERTTFSLPLAVLAAGVNRVQFAAQKPDKATAPALAMVQFQITEGGNLLTTATNGTVLSHANTPIPDWEGEPVNLLFPQTKILTHLLNLAPDATAHVMIAGYKILIAVKSETAEYEIVLNTADLPYPDWQVIRQHKPTLSAITSLKIMRDLLTRANAICPTQRVGLKLTGKDKRLTLGAKNETTEHRDGIDLNIIVTPDAEGKPQPFDGEFVIYVSPETLAAALNASASWTNAENVRLGFSAPTKPFIVNPVGFQYSHWISPMAATT